MRGRRAGYLVLLAGIGCVTEPDIDIPASFGLTVQKMDTIDGWYRFTEGPTRDPNGNVYFSDLVTKKIYRWDANDDTVEVVRDNGEATNGLFVGVDGRLFVCEPYQRRVVVIDREGRSTVVASHYDGKRFNSPNDVWVAPNGGVYFTDPRYTAERVMEQDGEHVYYVPPRGGTIVRVVDDLKKPNGVVGTSDGRTLYIADDGAHRTYRYDIGADGSLSNRRVAANAGSDGLTLDAAQRLYVVGDGVLIYDRNGVRVGAIDTPFFSTNATFGGENGDILFVTGKWLVHRITLDTTGDFARAATSTTTSTTADP